MNHNPSLQPVNLFLIGQYVTAAAILTAVCGAWWLRKTRTVTP